LSRLRDLYHWPRLGADVADYVKHCQTCQIHKAEQQLPAGKMGKRVTADKPWRVICSDLMGPFPLSAGKQNRFLLVVADCFTKHALLFPLRTASAKRVTQHIVEDVIYHWGAPQYILCDNGV
jgi:hypothetical protein